jgi:hypothetical protein
MELQILALDKYKKVAVLNGLRNIIQFNRATFSSTCLKPGHSYVMVFSVKVRG